MTSIDCMLELLPREGEYEIVKRTKYGVYVRIGTSNVFMPNAVLTEEDDDDDDDLPDCDVRG